MSVPEIDHTRLKALFGDVCELPTPEAARARLAELRATPEECAQVLQLLAHDDGHTTHLSAPVKHMVASAAGGELQPGNRLGAWTLVRELGAGGMGRVFEAQRSDGHYEQRSAIKVLRGFSGEAALAQLAHERQLLATMNHPHIARLLDGGTTPAGNPYLVMEHVDGLRIDDHVRLHASDPEAVLNLFAMVCEAVAYAHRRRIVHCDIKPSNVLVDEEGRAKLLDFGIAQLQGLDASALHAMTPRYASPEQRQGAVATTASDIYSLGRLFQEMLAAAALQELGSERARELHAVAERATAADPVARHPDLPALIEDVERLRRHEQLVRERDRALRAEAQARQEALLAQQLTELVISLFDGADPFKGGHQDLRAIDLLDRGRERLDANLSLMTGLRAAMLAVLGRVYENLGHEMKALAIHEQSVALEPTLNPPQPLREADILSRMAIALTNNGRHLEALLPAERSLALRKPLVDAHAPEVGDSLNTLGFVLIMHERHEDAERHLMQALQVRRERLGTGHMDVAVTLHNLGFLYRRWVRYEEAERFTRQSLELKRALVEATHPEVLVSQGQLSELLANLGRVDEAIELARLNLAANLQVRGDDSVTTQSAFHGLAWVLDNAGLAAEAAVHAAQAASISEHTGNPTRLASNLSVGSRALAMHGDPAAEATLREALAQYLQHCEPEDGRVHDVQRRLAQWLLMVRQPVEARELLQAVWHHAQGRAEAENASGIDTLLLLAECEVVDGKLDAAAAWLARLEPLRSAFGKGSTYRDLRVRGLLAAARGEPQAAASWLRQALDAALGFHPARHALVLRIRVELAAALSLAGQGEEAAQVLADGEAFFADLHSQSPVLGSQRMLMRKLSDARKP